jgi:tryptophan synthase beta chain
VRFEAATDDETMAAFQLLLRQEGIIPALESAHAVAYVVRAAPAMPRDHCLVINLSGRGDKDIFIVAEYLGDPDWLRFLEDMASGRGREAADDGSARITE